MTNTHTMGRVGGMEGVPVRNKISKDAWACIFPLEACIRKNVTAKKKRKLWAPQMQGAA